MHGYWNTGGRRKQVDLQVIWQHICYIKENYLLNSLYVSKKLCNFEVKLFSILKIWSYFLHVCLPLHNEEKLNAAGLTLQVVSSNLSFDDLENAN